MMKTLLVILLVLCFLPEDISAHSFAIYVSTPVTPPVEFIWVFWVYVIVFVVLNILLKKKFFGARLIRSVLVSLSFLSCFVVSFFLIGSCAANAHTGPPPGLGMPCPTFWGYGFSEGGGLFILWNFLGLFILGVWCIIYFWTSENDTGRSAGIFGNILLYLLCMIPYMFSGAWLHGWAGSSVRHNCEHRLDILYEALVEYAVQNNDQFPEAKDLDTLLIQIQPNIKLGRFPSLASILICPKGKALEKEPKHFVWSEKFSGVKLQDLDPEQFYENVAPISCPYHKYSGRMGSTYILKMTIEEAKNKALLKKSMPETE